MPNSDDILWFKREFQAEIQDSLSDTPFDVDLITAIACRESGEMWPVLRKKDGFTRNRILLLCVGDTLDSDRGRRAFPKTKAHLLSKPNGSRMFEVAHQALVDMARHIPGYRGVARNADKFCHGYGIFQYDLQFFLDDPAFFLEQKYGTFHECLRRCIAELKRGLRTLGWQNKARLSDYEMACVGIAYNTGGFNPRKGLHQGHFDGSKHYGQAIFDFIRLSRTVAVPGRESASLAAPARGRALVSTPVPVAAAGPIYEVNTRESTLRVRSQPSISRTDPLGNVIGELPDGHLLRVLGSRKHGDFQEIETSISGAHYHGFVASEFITPSPSAKSIPFVVPASTMPESGIMAVFMPRKSGTVTRRAQIAGAHSLNEPNQPGRAGETPEKLREELALIIDWLAVDKASHHRYLPRSGLTFCNIYAHDYCHLSGIYLPRVWWTASAIESLSRGESVEPKYESTIDEQRANDLFRWLRDFGPRFGWRRAGTLSELQIEANQGAIGLVVARRKQDGKSGHIVVIVPETEQHRAGRSAEGDVTTPLQSQAGARNFRYGRGTRDWWKDSRFAESAFWLHA
jgi:hypothetical protein